MKKLYIVFIALLFCLMFSGCGKEVTFKYQVLSNGTECEILGISDKTITKLVIPETIDGLTVTKIGWSAFMDCTELKTVELPSSLKIIEMGAFSGCSKLKNIKFPSGLEEIRTSAFKDCVSLKKIELPEGLKVAKGFDGCRGIEELNIPSSVQSIQVSSDCPIKKIYVNPKNELLTSRDDSGNECNAVIVKKNFEKKLYVSVLLLGKGGTIPEGALDIGTVIEDDERTSIYIPKSITHMNKDTFEAYPNLTTIYGVPGSYAETWATDNGYTFVGQ